MNNNWHTDLLYPLYTNQVNETYGGILYYYNEAFLTIQDRISRFFIETICNTKQCLGDLYIPKVLIQQLPYPAYTFDSLSNCMEVVISLFIMFGFVHHSIVTVRFIAVEKEKQLQDMMSIMGMPKWLYSVSWFCIAYILLIISMSLVTVILTVIDSSLIIFHI